MATRQRVKLTYKKRHTTEPITIEKSERIERLIARLVAEAFLSEHPSGTSSNHPEKPIGQDYTEPQCDRRTKNA